MAAEEARGAWKGRITCNAEMGAKAGTLVSFSQWSWPYGAVKKMGLSTRATTAVLR